MGCYKVGANVAAAGGRRLRAGETVRIEDHELEVYEHLLHTNPPLMVPVPCPEEGGRGRWPEADETAQPEVYEPAPASVEPDESFLDEA